MGSPIENRLRAVVSEAFEAGTPIITSYFQHCCFPPEVGAEVAEGDTQAEKFELTQNGTRVGPASPSDPLPKPVDGGRAGCPMIRRGLDHGSIFKAGEITYIVRVARTQPVNGSDTVFEYGFCATAVREPAEASDGP